MQYTAELLLLLTFSFLVTGYPKSDEIHEKEPTKLDLSVEKLSKREENTQKREEQNVENVPKGRQQDFGSQLVLGRQQFPVLGQYGLGYLEPQLQFPAFNFIPQEKQVFPRVQPQILFYGPGGQGQPILINPGNPPGNFLVPQAPGPNVLVRGGPQNPGVFAGDYPKSAHIPPIEKDAEEIPTNPSKILPLPSASTARPSNKPEKLETFNEGRNELHTRHDEKTKLSPDSLRPGLRFFYLNGESLFPNFNQDSKDLIDYARPLPEYQPSPQFHSQQIIPAGSAPTQGVLLENSVDVPGANQHEGFRPVTLQDNLGTLGFFNQPLEPYFRGTGPVGSEEPQEVGRFRFTPPETGVFPFRDDVENDAIIVDANFERDASGGTNGESSSTSPSASDDSSTAGPSMAQAAPGAVAIAGPGGVAGSAPRGTALVGRGGLAVASPQATAVAGTRDDEDEKKKASTTKRSVDKSQKN